MRLPRAVQLAAAAVLEKKAEDVVALDVRQACSFTDYLLLVSGTNQRQVIAIVDAVLEALRADHLRPDHLEGYPKREWILLDYGSFIVHVFTPRTRSFYDLERLWGQADRQEMTP
jgi:ribosome-associated protein